MAEVNVTASPAFRELHPKVSIPAFVWLKVGGRAETDDFSLDHYLRLQSSERAIELLRRFDLEGCQIFDAAKALSPDEIAAEIFEQAKSRNRRAK